MATGFGLLKRNEEYIRTPEEFNLMNRIVAVQECPEGVPSARRKEAK
jgi:hypothetical protein